MSPCQSRWSSKRLVITEIRGDAVTSAHCWLDSSATTPASGAGARSDSDLYTYGYGFKPWRGRSIATADEIRAYLAEVIRGGLQAIPKGQLEAADTLGLSY